MGRGWLAATRFGDSLERDKLQRCELDRWKSAGGLGLDGEHKFANGDGEQDAVTLSPKIVRGDTAQQLAEGRVFYGPWQLRMPDRQPEQGVAGYIASHPLSVARLMVARIAAEAAHIRPGYSDRRNLVFGVWAGTIWLLALPGMWLWRNTGFTWLAVGVIAAQFGLVAVTFADIEGRFLIHVVGPIALCGGLAVGRLAGEREVLPVRT